MRKDLEIPPDPWDAPRFRLARFGENGKQPAPHEMTVGKELRFR
jgi:hypothetical protein